MSETPQQRAQRLMPLAFALLALSYVLIPVVAVALVLLAGWGVIQLDGVVNGGGR